MSALLFSLRRDRIDVLADSCAFGFPGGVAKVWPIVHAPAVICGRGPAGLLIDVALRCAALAGDFDSLVEGMAKELDAALRANAANIAKLVGRDRRVEVYAAGISRSARRATVCSYLLMDGEASSSCYQRTQETGDFLVCSPWVEEELGPVPEITASMTGDELRALLRDVHRRQIQLMNSQWAEGSAGGRRVEIAITSGSITSRVFAEEE
jgi:hypothetical protein